MVRWNLLLERSLLQAGASSDPDPLRQQSIPADPDHPSQNGLGPGHDLVQRNSLRQRTTPISLNTHTMHLPPENLHPRRSYTSLHDQHTPLIHTGTRDHPQSVSYDPALGSGSPAGSPRGRLCTSNRYYPTGRSLFGACTSYRWECHALHIFQYHNASVPRSAVSPISHDLFVFHPLWRILTFWYS
jgi:hypothetical protein